MIIEKLSEAIDEIYGDSDSVIPIYASEANSKAFMKNEESLKSIKKEI